MALILGLAGVAALYFWLRGHWFGWVLMFFPAFWLTQMTLTSGHGADAPGIIAIRAIVVLLATGIPCVVWGSFSRFS
jgi:hypothetical protein